MAPKKLHELVIAVGILMLLQTIVWLFLANSKAGVTIAILFSVATLSGVIYVACLLKQHDRNLRSVVEKLDKGQATISVLKGGKLVKTPDLVDALKSGHLAGAGLDVTDPEPLPSGHALWAFPNVIITSHISAASQHSSNRMQDVFVSNVNRFVKDLPMLNLVDKEMGF